MRGIGLTILIATTISCSSDTSSAGMTCEQAKAAERKAWAAYTSDSAGIDPELAGLVGEEVARRPTSAEDIAKLQQQALALDKVDPELAKQVRAVAEASRAAAEACAR